MKTLVIIAIAALVCACQPAPPEDSADYEPAGEVAANGGSEDWTEVRRAMGLDASHPQAAPRAAPVEELIQGLEQRAMAHGDNVDDWILLAQSYAHVGRMDDAAAAVERAVELGADEERVRAEVRRTLLERPLD